MAEMLLGWAVGGLFFGILGDKYGRSRMMLWTILVYSIFTALSGLSFSFWDFLLFRFLAGLGVGGQFVIGVALVAETMPDRIRPYALGFLQQFAILGVLAVTFFSMGTGDAWRIVLMIGTLPVVLVYFVVQYLDEPERWKLAVRDQDEGHQNAGSFRELFGPVYRRRTILGMVLASTGAVGLWGIGNFSIDHCRNVGRRLAVERLKAGGGADYDIAMIGILVVYPALIDDTHDLTPKILFGTEKTNGDVRYLFEAIRDLRENKRPITDDSVADEAIHRWNLAEGKGRQTSAIPLDEVQQRKAFFLGRLRRITSSLEDSECVPLPGADLWKLRRQELAEILQRIDDRTKLIEQETASWGTTTLLLMNIGALFGMFSFTMATSRLGRRMTFTIFLAASMLSVLGVFLFSNGQWGIYTQAPVMGFFLSALFGGLSIYLPELFPTRIRSTAIALCCSVGLFVAAFFLGTLQSGFDEPIRRISVTMSSILLIGIAVVWMLPETKNKPLP